MQDRGHTRAIGLMVLAALCWSLAGVLVKYIGWPPLAIAGGRGLLAAIFLIVFNWPLRFTWSRLQISAAVAYAACTITFVTATKLTTAANAILLQYTAPVYVALLSAWFLGERVRPADWAALGVVLAGMGLFFGDELKFENLTGNVIAIVSGVCFAAMTLLMRKQKDGSPAESLVLGNLIAFVIGLPWIARAPALPGSGWLALLVLGFVQLGLSYWLYARAIKHITALELVLLPVLEPILNPLWTWLAYGEHPGRWAFFGALLVLGGVTTNACLSLRRARSTVAVPLAES